MAYTNARAGKTLFIPPELRAMARVISDADITQFPELAEPVGQVGPRAREVRRLTTELNDGVPLSARDLVLLRAAFFECRQHLHGVNASLMTSGTPGGTVLSLTMRLDMLCTEAGLALPIFFPQLQPLHDFVGTVVEGSGTYHHDTVVDRLLVAISKLLQRAVDGVREYHIFCEQKRRTREQLSWEPQHAAQTDLAERATTLTSPLHLPPIKGAAVVDESEDRAGSTAYHRHPSPPLTRGSSRANLRRRRSKVFHFSLTEPPVESEEDEEEEEEDTFEMAEFLYREGGEFGPASLAELPDAVAEAFCEANAHLAVFFAHLQWYISVTAGTGATAGHQNADPYLDDLAVRRAWTTYMGRAHVAGTLEEVMPPLAMFQFAGWVERPLLRLLHMNECGVVSLFAVQRVLRVWGPALLVERNFGEDLRSGVISVDKPFEYYHHMLARMPDAAPGDFVVALTERLGEVRVVVLLAARKKSLADTASQPHTAAGRSAHRRSKPLTSSRAAKRVPSRSGLTQKTHSTLRARREGDSGNSGAAQQLPRVPHTSFIEPHAPADSRRHVAAQPPSAKQSTRLVQFSALNDPPRTMVTNGLLTTSYRISQETGAWMVQGLTREEFESISEACRAFPDIFRRPRGYRVPPEEYAEMERTMKEQQPSHMTTPSTSKDTLAPAADTSPAKKAAAEGVAKKAAPNTTDGSGGSSSSNANAAAEGSGIGDTAAPVFSALHRACFRNNAHYVRTLLQRGAATIVNTAVVDPMVSPEYCWTPLMCAVNNPNSDPAEVVVMLLECGADVQYTDDADCTALYYAIANSYAGATAVLLEHCPTLHTSPATVPLLVALGAHHYHFRESDIRRLGDLVPSTAVLESVARHSNHYGLMSLAVEILQDKLRGEDTQLRPQETNVVMNLCPAKAAAVELHTTYITDILAQLIADHTRLCVQNRQDVNAAVQVLHSRCYLLSLRNWLQTQRLSEGSTAHRRSECGGGEGLSATVETLARFSEISFDTETNAGSKGLLWEGCNTTTDDTEDYVI